jgi:hypothetical protein
VPRSGVGSFAGVDHGRGVVDECRFERVKHAGSAALEGAEDLLKPLRGIPGLVERKPGIFYRRSRAFLHFHEDPSGLYADVKLLPDEDFVRMPVNTRAERTRLLREVRKVTAA